MTNSLDPLAASVRDRLANHAREQARTFQEILQYYAIERFLYRLAQSEHCDKFVLKGGLAFFAWRVPLRRSTKDIDFHGFTSNAIEHLQEIIKDICIQPVESDGMVFDASTVCGDLIQGQAEYQGARIRFTANLGSARISMQIDIGFSDIIVPPAINIDYPTILDMPEPRLRAYTYETAIAEKLQAMVFLGSINSRMKDFYDIWLLTREVTIRGSALQQAISLTFKNRNTRIPGNTTLPLSPAFAQEKQQQWLAFRRRVGESNIAPNDFAEVVLELGYFFLPVLEAVRTGTSFGGIWKPGKRWQFS